MGMKFSNEGCEYMALKGALLIGSLRVRPPVKKKSNLGAFLGIFRL